jgi:hypothetical protein
MGGDEPPPLPSPLVERATEHGVGRFTDVLEDLRAGRGFAAHRKLLALRRSPLARADRNAVEAALADRRLFVEPTEKAPGLGRLNGFGTGVYGNSAFDREDGTYVATRCASAFWIPVFPIDQWLVRSAEGGGWYFLARVPLDLGARRLRALSIAGAALVAAIVAIAVAWGSTHSTLSLVNGLDATATVTIDDGPPVTVHSKGRSVVELDSGPHRFRCTVGGRVIDELTATVSGTADLVVYNVAGSAPLVLEEVVYTNEAARADAAPPSPLVHCLVGSVFVQREDVDDVFREPPQSVNLSSRERRKVRLHAFVVDGGWRRSVELLDERNLSAKPEDVAEAVALAQPGEAEAVAECVEISKAGRSDAEHAAFLERLAAAKAQVRR